MDRPRLYDTQSMLHRLATRRAFETIEVLAREPKTETLRAHPPVLEMTVDRHGGVGFQVGEFSRLVGADHDGVGIAAEYAGGVGHGFAAP